MRTRACGLLLLILFSLVSYQTILAQNEETQASASLSQPDIDHFPLIHVFMDVRDSNGNFIHNIESEDVYIIEDEQAISDIHLQEIRQGLQAVIVLNPGIEFARRNSQAISRYDIILETLESWIKSRAGTTIDDISILVTGGPVLQHVNNASGLLTLLDEVNSEARDAVPNLDSAFQAVELAADPTDRPGLGRAILLITPPLDQDFSQSIDNLAARAQELGVRIYIWMVGPNDSSSLQAGERLDFLARSTNGSYFLFSGEEPLPFIEDYFEPLREIYSLTYSSQIRTSGVHNVSVEISSESGTITSPPRTFEVSIQPPAPAFIKPPINIRRELVEQGNENSPVSTQNSPEIIPLEIIVDFPDGQVRPIAHSSFFVDGVLTIENNQPPFERFNWDISSYTTDGTHSVRAEVTDQLGLTGSSTENLVYLTVDRPVSNWMRLLSTKYPILAIVTIMMAGALIFLVLILGGRIRPYQIGRDKPKKKIIDPITQPIPEPPAHIQTKPSWTARLHWPRRQSSRSFAYLVPLEDTGVPQAAQQNLPAPESSKRKQRIPPFQIYTEDTTIGSDPARSILLLTDPSVEGYHARLTRQKNGVFVLKDEGSTAGTWVNFTQVPIEGTEVQHGDIIHIGGSGFRFALHKPDRSELND